MRLELAIAGRLSLKAPGIPVAVAGIALSVAVMLLSIAIVSGFKHQIRDKVTGFEHEISIYPGFVPSDEYVNNGIQLTDSLKEVIDEISPDAKIALEIRQPAIFKTDNDFEGIVIKGVDKSGNTFITNQITEGDIPDWSSEFDTYPVLISESTASALGLKIDDAVMAHFFIGDNLYTRKLNVAAIFNTHFGEYDKTYAFTPIELLQKICKVDSITGSSVSIDCTGKDIEETANNLRLRLCEIREDDKGYYPQYRIETINTTGAMYFNWLELLDTNVVVILLLMGCVAGFTLVSCLFIIVLERVRMIGLLKALGATDGMIRRIFIYMACRLVSRGLIIGNLFALALLFAQKIWHIIPLDPEAYYLSYVPVSINWVSILALDVAVIALSFILLVLPSHIISTLSPSETMRYE